MNITIQRDGQNYGPYTLDQIHEYLANGTVSESDWAWYEGCTDWLPVGNVISLLTLPPLPLQSQLPPIPREVEKPIVPNYNNSNNATVIDWPFVINCCFVTMLKICIFIGVIIAIIIAL
jgi:hypothetical protein